MSLEIAVVIKLQWYHRRTLAPEMVIFRQAVKAVTKIKLVCHMSDDFKIVRLYTNRGVRNSSVVVFMMKRYSVWTLLSYNHKSPGIAATVSYEANNVHSGWMLGYIDCAIICAWLKEI
jgi:hypothetical protein